MPRPWSRYVLSSLLLALLAAGPVAAEDPPTAAALYARALEHDAAGHAEAAREAYEQVLRVDPEHRAARRALGYEEVDGYWLKGDDLKRARGFVHHDGRWMTADEFAAATRPARDTWAAKQAEGVVLGWLAKVAGSGAEVRAAARRHLAAVPAEHRLPPLARALRCEPASLRVFVAGELAALGDPLAVPALLRRTIVDPDEEVRRAAAEALRVIHAPATFVPLARALYSRDATVRVRAAEAIGALRDVQAAPYVIARWEKRSGNFTRVYLATVKQISFIQDFDVEVASTSFIADPIVGVLQEGIVHDVRILATEQTGTSIERVAYRGALRALAGRDLGDDVKAWKAWWTEREAGE